MEYILFNAPFIWSDRQRTDIVPDVIGSDGSRRSMTNNTFTWPEAQEPHRTDEFTSLCWTLEGHDVLNTQKTPLDDKIAHKSTAVGHTDLGGGGCHDCPAIETTRDCRTDESTPISFENRRKSQNRAAQRAFVQRRKQHIRHLEAKVSELECKRNALQAENEQLEYNLERICADNEALRTASMQSDIPLQQETIGRPAANVAPLGRGSRGFHYNMQHLSTITDMQFIDRKRATRTQAGVSSIQATAAWFLLQTHPLVQQGIIDISYDTDLILNLRIQDAAL